MSADGAGRFALRGLGKMVSVSKQGMAAFSGGIQKVRKSHASKHETDVLNELKKRGLHPSDILFEAMQRLDYLSLAGYKNEVTVVSQQTAKRLLEPEKSTVPLELTLLLSTSMSDEALKFGNFQKSSVLQGLQDYLNLARMGKEHIDRDTIVHDLYYAILLCSEEFGDDWQQFEQVCKEVVGRVVTLGEAGDINQEPQQKAARTVFTFASAIKIAAKQEESKRHKSLREAEALIQREQEKRAKALALQIAHNQKPQGEPTAIETSVAPPHTEMGFQPPQTETPVRRSYTEPSSLRMP